MEFLKGAFCGQVENGVSESMHFLSDEIRAVLLRFRISGALPLTFTSSGAKFEFTSHSMLYCILFYTFSLPFLLLTLCEASKPIRNSERIDEIIFSQLYICMLVPYLFLPLTLWLDTPHIAVYLNDWTNYQKRYYDVAGKRLPMHFQTQCYIDIFRSSIASVAFVVIWTVTPPFVKPFYGGVYLMYCISLMFPTQILWTYNCKAFYVAGISLRQSLEEAIEQPVSASKIFELKMLWLDLSHLTDQFGHSFYRFYALCNMTTFWFITSSLFGCLTCLRSGHYARIFVFAPTFLFSSIPFFMTIDYAHCVPFHVCDGVQKTLGKISLTSLEAGAHYEVNSFLECTSYQSHAITLGGFVKMNRQLFLVAGGTCITYIVVMLQIRQSDIYEH